MSQLALVCDARRPEAQRRWMKQPYSFRKATNRQVCACAVAICQHTRRSLMFETFQMVRVFCTRLSQVHAWEAEIPHIALYGGQSDFLAKELPAKAPLPPATDAGAPPAAGGGAAGPAAGAAAAEIAAAASPAASAVAGAASGGNGAGGGGGFLGSLRRLWPGSK